MPPKRSCWEIYKKEMSQLNRGDALWEPAPPPDLERIQPGDVGYILKGCFHLLFSAGRPLGERELGVDVPQTFKQLSVGPTFNTQPRSPGYLSTDTVEEISVHVRAPMYPRLEPGSSISFQLTGGQGAALLTKHPTYREDAKLGRTFEEYTKTHYNSWVAFARECGHPNDIKPVLVTGVDVTRDFAMVSYSNDGNDLRAQFTTSAPEAGSPWGTWRAPGVVHTNCGPQPSRPPSGNSQTEAVSDGYNQCVFVRYYTMRKRLGIPRVIKAAAGPHDLGPPDRDDPESSSDVEHSSDSDSDIASSLFDDDGDDDGGSVTSIDSEPDVAIHNTAPDERDDFDTIADYVFQNSDADSVLIHHRDIARLRELGDGMDLFTQLVENRPSVTIDRNGVGTIGRQTDVARPIPLFAPSKIEREVTDRIATPGPRPPSCQDDDYVSEFTSPLVAYGDEFGALFHNTPLFDNVGLFEPPSFPSVHPDDVYTISTATPALDASPLFIYPPSQLSSNLPTGTRKNLTLGALIPLDAPAKPRSYLTPSATSRKDHARKRSRSEALGGDDDEANKDVGELDSIAAKRLQNTLAARRSRRRKLHQLEPEANSEHEKQQKEIWRSRAMALEALLLSAGIPVPPAVDH